MRWLKMLALGLPLLLGAAACGPTPGQVYQEMLDISFKGRPIDRMVEGFGPPDEKTPAAYTWKKKYSWETGGFSYECTRREDVYDKEGNVIGHTEADDTCYVPKRTHTDWCDTTAFFDPAQVVTSFKFDGSRMGGKNLFAGPRHSGCFLNNAATILDEPDMFFRKYGEGAESLEYSRGWRYSNDVKKLSRDFSPSRAFK